MPYRRQDSAVWWVSYRDPNGKRLRRSTDTTDRKEADALEAKWKIESYRAKQWDEAPPRGLDELMLAYLTAHAGKRSATRDIGIARHLRQAFGGLDVTDISGQRVRGYIQTRKDAGVKPGTINRELALLSTMLTYARVELEWDNVSNAVTGRKLPTPEGRVRWLSRAEAARLIVAARALPRARWLADFIILALHTGMRRGEILGMEWRRVDLAAGLIHLDGSGTKSGKRRSVPINATARMAILTRLRWKATHAPGTEWVFSHLDGTRIADVKKSFHAACGKAQIADFRIHDLRHTCAAWLVSAGVELSAVRDLLGHASVQTTEIYAHLSPENVRAAVAVLDDVRSRSGHAGFHPSRKSA